MTFLPLRNSYPMVFHPSTPPLLPLTHNKFFFISHHYLQIKGIYMRTRIAPSYVNLFMRNLGKDFLKSEDYWYQHDLLFRFIYDIFLLWTHGHNYLLTLLECLNNNNPVQFTWIISSSMVSKYMLICFVSIPQSTSNSSTNSNNSTHPAATPPSVKCSLLISQAIRGRRICSHLRNVFIFFLAFASLSLSSPSQMLDFPYQSTIPTE